MGKNSKIEWCDHTFNPWIGCTKVSPGCAHCYAEVSTPARTARAQGRETWGKGAQRMRTGESYWEQPHKWERESLARIDAGGQPARVFCSSLADMFDPEVPAQWFLDLAQLITLCPGLTWMLLTKRPENILPRLTLATLWRGFPSNVQIGCTVENQEWANKRRDIFKEVPATVKYVSYEPALGKVDWTGWEFINGLICGGESGHAARPMNPAWARASREWCAANNVPFFFKQWGEWVDTSNAPAGLISGDDLLAASLERRIVMHRVGKHRAGRILDGVEHNSLPR